MKTKISLVLLLVLLATPVTARPLGGADLILYKQALVDFYVRAEVCDSLFKVDRDEDIPSIGRDFRDYWCQGRYTVILYGPPGTTVTLFGQFDYGTELGYLIIKKTDNQKVWLLELNFFPKNQWHRVEARRASGAYDVYFHPIADFDERISSVKWGTWWSGPEPGDQVPPPLGKS